MSDEETINQKPPKQVYLVFIGIFLLAFFNLLSSGFNPFGSFNSLFAQMRRAPNAGELVANMRGFGSQLEGIRPLDSYDRCMVIDPQMNQEYSVADASASRVLSSEGNYGGLNQGFPIGGVNEDVKDLFEITADTMGMSYTIGIVSDIETNLAGTAQATANFIDEANNHGLVPIVRLCYVGECKGFSIPSNVANFYRQVRNNSSGEFVAILGPNEPYSDEFGTGASEYTGFGDTPEQSIRNAEIIARELQDIREDGVLLAPGAINITRGYDAQSPGAGSEVSLFRDNISDPTLFDVLMATAYEIGNMNRTTYELYQSDNHGQSLQDWASETGLDVVFTEFGIFKEGGVRTDSKLIQDAVLSSLQFCADENVKGLLFFRSVNPAEVDNKALFSSFMHDPKHTISLNDMDLIIGGCEKSLGGSRMAEHAWLNCNFDSCVYEYEYDSRSVASACVSQAPAPIRSVNDGAYLQMRCEGGYCNAHKRHTVEVSLPIKQFGSTSPAGTPNFNYTPICAEMAFQYAQITDPNDKEYLEDALNQFAGVLEGKGGTSDYPMPWLGSAINCASELIKKVPENSHRYSIDFNPHPGSNFMETLKELELEKNPNTKAFDFTSEDLSNNSRVIIDERTICFMTGRDLESKFCVGKEASSNLASTYQQYNPAIVRQNYVFPENANSCSTGQIAVRNEINNYIVGPEVYLGGSQMIGEISAGDLCKEYATRNIGNSKDRAYAFDPYIPNSTKYPMPLFCKVSEMEYSSDPNEESHRFQCRAYASQLQSCFGFTGDDDSQANYGKCNLSPSIPSHCIYVESGNGAYYKDTSSPAAPEYEIPGMYDALSELYTRLQTNMSQRGLKVVFRENIGWEARVSVKTRDVNKGISDENKTEYAYNQVLTDKEGDSVCEVTKDLFDNSMLLAKNKPVRTHKYYYDWLGYVDIIQEWTKVYNNNTIASGETYIPDVLENNRYDFLADLKDSLDEEMFDYFLESGAASQMTRFPILTCSDVELLEIKLNTDDSGVLLQKTDENYQELNMSCIASMQDNRYEDELGKFLCDKGYNMYGSCEAVCKVETTNTTASLGNKICHPGNTCDSTIQQGKNGVNYPACRDMIKVQGTDGLCGALPQLNRQFGTGSDSVLNSSATLLERAKSIEDAAQAKSQNITAFGTYQTIQTHIIPYIRAAEAEIAQWKNDDNTYSFPSGPYKFVSCGGFNRRAESAIRSAGANADLSYVLSMHSFGLAMDFNCVDSNKFYFTDRVCTLDLPPEFVTAMENNGFRWGGRFGGERYDPMHFEWNNYCFADVANGINKIDKILPADLPRSTVTSTQVCTINDEEVKPPEGNTPAGQACNEFNCGLGYDRNNLFSNSLSCAADTLAANISRSQNDLAFMLDRYGPYCDNETRGIVCMMGEGLSYIRCTLDPSITEDRICTTNSNGRVNHCKIKSLDVPYRYKSSMPFAYNFIEFYDSFAPTNAQRSCSAKPPSAPRAEDAGLTCSSFTRTWSNPRADSDSWKYYRGALDTCNLTDAQMKWAVGSGGLSVDALTDDVMSRVNYSGFYLSAVPREKVKAVIQKARDNNINPFLLLGMWATESWFGQYNAACNVY